MNQFNIIGNLTRDPELRSTNDGTSVCSFTVAVNRRGKSAKANQPEADYVRVTAWRELGENCAKYLAKGRRVFVSGNASVSLYTGQDNQAHASLDLTARDVEFLTPKSDSNSESGEPAPAQAQKHDDFVQVNPEDELPF